MEKENYELEYKRNNELIMELEELEYSLKYINLCLGDEGKPGYFIENSSKPEFYIDENDIEKSILGNCSLENLIRHWEKMNESEGQLKLFNHKPIFSKEFLCATLLAKLDQEDFGY